MAEPCNRVAMTNKELVKSLLDTELRCDRNCFALANRFLNKVGYQAKVTQLNMTDGEITFVIRPLRLQ